MDTRLKLRQVKICPLVLRRGRNSVEVLLFKHPLAGVQLVKGTLEESDHSIEAAGLRELAEESGIKAVYNSHYLGQWESGFQQQLWHFVRCECDPLPDRWTFHTLDDGGHDFEFFWHDLSQPISFDCHQVFANALEHIQTTYL